MLKLIESIGHWALTNHLEQSIVCLLVGLLSGYLLKDWISFKGKNGRTR